MITLFKSTETDFTHNGIGSLSKNITNAVVEEELNGLYSFVFKYPIFAPYGSEIDGQSILRVPTPDGDQLFRVYNPVKSMGYLTIKAYHIFYDLVDNFIEDTNIVGKSGQGAIAQLGGATQFGHSFRFFSDIETVTNARMVRMNPVAALIDNGTSNTFISRWGGELKRNNFDVRMNKSIGSNRGKKIRHRKDLVGYEADIDWSTAVTRIMPKGFDGLLLPEKYVDSPLINHYIHPKIKMIEYSDIKAAIGEYADDEDAVPLETAYQMLREAAEEEYLLYKIDVPEANYKVDFVNLDQTKEYKDLRELQQVFLGDTVTVIHEDDGLFIEAKVIGYKYDPILNRYTELKLGSFKETFSSTYSDITNLSREVAELIKTTNYVQSTADGKNTINRGTSEPLNPNVNDLWFKPNGIEMELWQYVEESGQKFWKLISSTAELTNVKKEVEAIIAQAETDREKTQQNITKAIQEANDYAEFLSTKWNTDFNLEVNKINREINDARDNAIADAKIYTNTKTTELNNYLETVKQDVISISTTANDAVTKADKAINDVGFMKVDVNDAKATAIDAFTAVQKVTGDVNKLTTSFDELTQTVGFKAEKTTVDAVTKQVNQNELSIAANAREIGLRMTSTQVDSLVTSKGYVNQAQLTATSEKWNLALTQVSSDLSDLEISDRNLLKNSNKFRKGSTAGGLSAGLTPEGYVEIIASAGNLNWVNGFIDYNDFLIDEIKTGDKFTISFTIKSPNASYTTPPKVYMNAIMGAYYQMKGSIGKEFSTVYYTGVWSGTVLSLHVGFSSLVGTYIIKNIKIQKSDKATDWTPAPEDMATLEQFTTIDVTVKGLQTTVGNKAEQSQVTQLAGQVSSKVESSIYNSKMTQLDSSINARVEKNNVITQINLSAETNTILIQGKRIQLDGQVNMDAAFISKMKAFSVEAVNADIANIRTKILTADVITSIHLKVDNAMMDKLTANTAVVNYLFTKTAFVDNLNTKTLSAITANIATIRSQLLVANVVEATHLKADAATITKLFATAANVNVLTSNTAFINNVKAIEISADKVTTGALNAAKVDIINMNASNITSGTLNAINITGTKITNNFSVTSEGATLNGTTVIAGDYRMNYTVAQTGQTGNMLITPIVLSSQILTKAGSLVSSWEISSTGLRVSNSGLATAYTASGFTFYPSGSGTPATVQYIPGNARIAISSFNGVELGAVVGGQHSVRFAVGGGNGVDPFVDMRARTTIYDNVLTVYGDIEARTTGSGDKTILRNVGGNGWLGARWSLRLAMLGGDNNTAYEKIRIENGGTTYFHDILMNGYTIKNQSDRRLKTAIRDTELKALDLIKSYRFVDFLWMDKNKPQELQTGLIAQETAYLSSMGTDGYLVIDSGKQNMLNSQAIQELSKVVDLDSYRLDEAEKDLNDLNNLSVVNEMQLTDHEKRIKELEEKVKELEGKVA